MNIHNKDVIILQSELATCKLHVARIKMALKRTNDIFPLKIENINNISEENLGFLEILTSRFAKLQDNLGQKIFPALLRLLI